jgi:cytochrome c553
MRDIPAGCSESRTPRWTPALAALATVALLGARAPAVLADEADLITARHAELVAFTVCGTCHGVTGNSTQPKFPRLAGQNANYLIAQLKAFRAQTRGDPDAISYMWGMASELDDATIAALAAYYHAQTPEPSARSSTPATAGRDIYEHGNPAEGVPACRACHGSDAHGTADYPRLAGQHAQYLLKQLASFQSNMRNVAVMHGVAVSLRLPEMQAVAAYLEAQP